jgi:predicted nucleotidyltransferase
MSSIPLNEELVQSLIKRYSGNMVERVEASLKTFAEKRNEVLGVIIFGSQAQGRARESSDVDVALYIDPAAIPADALQVQLRYTVELERAIGKRVDLVLLNLAPPMLRHQIFRNGKLVFERDQLRVRRFIGDALVEFYDEIVTLEAAQHTLIRRHLLGR